MDYHRLNAIWSAPWRAGTKIVAIAIIDDAVAWPSYERIAQRAGMCKRQAIREVETLEQLGVFRVERVDEDGRRLPGNRYRWILTTGDSQSPPPGGSGPTAGDSQSPASDDAGAAGDQQSPHFDNSTPGAFDAGASQSPARCLPVTTEVTGSHHRGDSQSPYPCSHQRDTTTPTGQPGGGGSVEKSKEANRARLEAQLDDLMVARGPQATPRWIRLAQDRGARSLPEYLDCIRFAVRAARADGHTVNYATDVVAYAARWRPSSDRLRGIA